jgi:hypothetical protein
MKQKYLQEFCNLAYERHYIYTRKEEGQPKPWTDNKVFQEWRFCNVFRHLDKVTKYIIKSIIQPNEDRSDLWKGIIVARFFSKITTIELLLREKCLFENHKEAVKLLKGVKEPIMTSAFILNPLQIKGKYYPKLYTPFYICKIIEEEHTVPLNGSLQYLFNIFVQLPSTAGFMAYEYVTDFSYSKRYFPVKPIDRYTWGNFTIGSLRGLKRICGLKPDKTKHNLPIEEMTKEILSYWQNDVYKKGLLDVKGFEPFKDISMREVEHWLCEYDKYKRISNGETNKLKRRYDGRH